MAPLPVKACATTLRCRVLEHKKTTDTVHCFPIKPAGLPWDCEMLHHCGLGPFSRPVGAVAPGSFQGSRQRGTTRQLHTPSDLGVLFAVSLAIELLPACPPACLPYTHPPSPPSVEHRATDVGCQDEAGPRRMVNERRIYKRGDHDVGPCRPSLPEVCLARQFIPSSAAIRLRIRAFIGRTLGCSGNVHLYMTLRIPGMVLPSGLLDIICQLGRFGLRQAAICRGRDFSLGGGGQQLILELANVDPCFWAR